MHDVAVFVAQNLDFDVARTPQVLLQIKLAVAKRGFCFGRGDLERFAHLIAVLRHLHAASAAAGAGFQQHGVADVVGDLQGFVFGSDSAVGPGHHGNSRFLRGLLRQHLVAHGADMDRRGADERQAVIGHHLGEFGILRQEAIARMDRVGAGDGRGRDDRGFVQIAFAR